MAKESRYNRFEKRRKNTKLITVLGIVGGLLAIFLLATTFLPFGDDNAKPSEEKPDASIDESSDQKDAEDQSQDSANEEEETNKDDAPSEEDQQNGEGSSGDVEISSSDKENVSKVIKKDWEPIGTEQEGAHTATFQKGTTDWDEMVEAIHLGAGLEESNSILWYVGNGGDSQSAVATITDKSQKEIYRVYVEWVDQKGWKPTKVEVLKENDQKDRY